MILEIYLFHLIPFTFVDDIPSNVNILNALNIFNEVYEIRMILNMDAQQPQSINSWKNTVLSHHGGSKHSSWWKQFRFSNSCLKETQKFTLDISKIYFIVFVHHKKSNNDKHRNNLLHYIGGPKNIILGLFKSNNGLTAINGKNMLMIMTIDLFGSKKKFMIN